MLDFKQIFFVAQKQKESLWPMQNEDNSKSMGFRGMYFTCPNQYRSI